MEGASGGDKDVMSGSHDVKDSASHFRVHMTIEVYNRAVYVQTHHLVVHDYYSIMLQATVTRRGRFESPWPDGRFSRLVVVRFCHPCMVATLRSEERRVGKECRGR